MLLLSRRIKIILLACLIFDAIFFMSTNGGVAILDGHAQLQKQGKVFVMYSASFIKAFEGEIGPSFEKKTGYTYTGEGRGSVQIANMITDGQRRPDIFVSAGTIPIKKLIMMNADAKREDEQQFHKSLVEWLVKFASAEIVIAYSSVSHFHVELEKAKIGLIPWYRVLSQPGFKFGRTDPELDPKGYYMVITAKLANIYYNDKNIGQRILGQDRNPRQVFPEESLITTLETGQLDAIAAYKHEAIARGLPYITLPSQINLASPTYSDIYKKASYTLITGNIIYGEPIYFSVTIPEATASNLQGAISFVTFLLSTDSKRILQNQGLNYIKPIAEGKVDKMPFAIRNAISMATAA
jgi:molybdate/tungstate transport system substrate-binding protein